MKFISIFFSALLLIGCSAGEIQSNTDHLSPYAPLNASDTGIHSIAYLDEGADLVRDARREDAFKKMFDYCDGRYVLLDEQGQVVGGNQTIHQETLDGYISTTLSSRYRTFYFKCADN
ncbi:hypothetical protein [Photobacterium sp. OFAV2-7]|uniref:hypothetical protein n=1 Tax=Photobacterium sp. OFAV2-7 TaxID=2917748 RepID=UPI001EF48947|nr:hypothetical protein [Photobacterium sp. OFAV2-7]MCG7584591.1 hypothetical protein [Photobacterium sp. OFAV2-7]